MNIKEQVNTIWSDYAFRSYLFAGFSLFSTFIFFVYNFVLGILYETVWNFSISIYYLILLFLRTMILVCEKQWRYDAEDVHRQKQIRLFRLTTRILILMDLALIIPITLMVLSQRTVTIGTIPAIAVATYTTYKTVLAVINYTKTRGQQNLSLFGLKMINLKDAIVSVVTLQNTLMMVFGDGASMLPFTACTSAAILAGMLIITLLLIRKGYRYSAANCTVQE